jgi:hypothetical protein
VSGQACGLNSYRIGKLLRHDTALRGCCSVRDVGNSIKERFKMRQLMYTITSIEQVQYIGAIRRRNPWRAVDIP